MQWFSKSGQTWCGQTILLLALCTAVGCSPVPKKYLREADPNVTLTTCCRSRPLPGQARHPGRRHSGGGRTGGLMVACGESPTRPGLPAATPAQPRRSRRRLVLGRRGGPSEVSKHAPPLGRLDRRRPHDRFSAWERTDAQDGLRPRAGHAGRS